MKEIHTETVIIWNLILGILKTPYSILMFIFGKYSLRQVIEPYHKLIKGLLEPRFTVSIIFLLIISFITSIFLSEELFDTLVLYPSDFLSYNFYTLITHGFLHAGLTHLFSNILIIYIFGRVVERELGSKNTAIIYFFGLVFAALFSSIINLLQGNVLGGIGASGAAMALVATGTLFKPFNFSYLMILPMPIFVIGWLAIFSDITGILNATQDGIGYFAHIGGYISAIIVLFLLKEQHDLKKGLIINGILALILFLIITYV